MRDRPESFAAAPGRLGGGPPAAETVCTLTVSAALGACRNTVQEDYWIATGDRNLVDLMRFRQPQSGHRVRGVCFWSLLNHGDERLDHVGIELPTGLAAQLVDRDLT